MELSERRIWMLATAASLALLTYFGFGLPGDPGRLVWSYLAYAAAAFVLAFLWRQAGHPGRAAR